MSFKSDIKDQIISERAEKELSHMNEEDFSEQAGEGASELRPTNLQKMSASATKELKPMTSWFENNQKDASEEDSEPQTPRKCIVTISSVVQGESEVYDDDEEVENNLLEKHQAML